MFYLTHFILAGKIDFVGTKNQGAMKISMTYDDVSMTMFFILL